MILLVEIFLSYCRLEYNLSCSFPFFRDHLKSFGGRNLLASGSAACSRLSSTCTLFKLHIGIGTNMTGTDLSRKMERCQHRHTQKTPGLDRKE